MKIPTVMDQAESNAWTLYNGDCVETMMGLPDNSIDLSVYSPPFSSLYIYSDSDRDMGNSDNDGQFFEHYRHAIREKFRITRPGRLSCVHCKQTTNLIGAGGDGGWNDFRGDVIRAHQSEGWVYHGEAVIWKCPVTQMYKTKSRRLLYKQLLSDSSVSGVGMPEYVLLFDKPCKNKEDRVPVKQTRERFPLDRWQEWASPIWPVWFDINQTRVLNGYIAREDQDEKHICPLQLDVIERCITMWSNPGEIVFSPFAGVGSEGFCAVKMGRRFVGVELKPAYYKHAVGYLKQAEQTLGSDMFEVAEYDAHHMDLPEVTA
jgi:DNA modification methylase